MFKTLYDKMPYGTVTEDRSEVNFKSNTAKFTHRERGRLEAIWRKEKRHPVNWIRYRLFKEWLHDQFVLKYYLKRPNALDSIGWKNTGKVVLMDVLVKELGWGPDD